MKQMMAAAVLALAAFSSGATAAEREVTLRIDNMYCASCPYIVKQTLADVSGVSHVQVSYRKEAAVVMAVVVYEDSETDVAALTAATSDVGFPSIVIN